jgi:hypothetical protein
MRAGYLRDIAIATLVLSLGIVFVSGQMSQASAYSYPADSCYWYYNSYYYWGYYGYPYYYNYGYPYWCYNGYYGYYGS